MSGKAEGERGVNVPGEKVSANIPHYCSLQMFCKPQLQLHAPLTFLKLPSTTFYTHTHFPTHILLAVHQQLKPKINSIMYHTSPLLRTTSLTYSTAHISESLQTHCIYSISCMQGDTFCVCFFAFCWGIFILYRYMRYKKNSHNHCGFTYSHF